MLRMSDDYFVVKEPKKDSVIAVRIKNGEFYFLGWMEDAETYDMQIALHPEKNQLDEDWFCDKRCLYNAVTSCPGYNEMILVKDESPYRKFLSYMENYERNHKRDEDDHDIFYLTEKELYMIYDSLRDGDYVFVISH